MQTSFSYEFQRLTPTTYEAALHGTVEDLGFSYRLGPPGKFDAILRSSCCDKIFRSSHNRPYDERSMFFCPACGKVSQYRRTVCERVFWATKWFESALDLHVDPFNAPIIAHDLGIVTRNVFYRWSSLQGHNDEHDEDLHGLRAEQSLRTLVEEFSSLAVGV